MTTGIVIVVHAPLGAAIRDCASHVMGNLDGMLAIHDIQPGRSAGRSGAASPQGHPGAGARRGRTGADRPDRRHARQYCQARRLRCPGPGHSVLRAGRIEHPDAAAGPDLIAICLWPKPARRRWPGASGVCLTCRLTGGSLPYYVGYPFRPIDGSTVCHQHCGLRRSHISMPNTDIVISNKLGLHALAAPLTQLASKFSSEIFISRGAQGA